MAEVHKAASSADFDALVTKPRGMLSRKERRILAHIRHVRDTEYAVRRARKAREQATMTLRIAEAEHEGALAYLSKLTAGSSGTRRAGKGSEKKTKGRKA